MLGRLARGTVLGALFLLSTSAAPAAAAEFGIVPGSVAVRTVDGVGDPDQRAGAHPDRLQAEFRFDVAGTGTTAGELAFEFSSGLEVDPGAAPICPEADFEAGTCDPESRLGTLTLRNTGEGAVAAPLFHLDPESGALLGLGAGSPWGTEFEISLRTGDYGLTISTDELPATEVEEGTIELWGVAADGAFLTTPTRCGTMRATLRARSREVDAAQLSESADSPPFLDCAGLPFAQDQFELDGINAVADSPSGAGIHVALPAYEDPAERVGAHPESMAVDLPAGVSLSVAGFAGKKACTDAQFALASRKAPGCDPASLLGSVELAGPSFEQPLTGSIYLGSGALGDRFRLFVAAAGESATVKMIGSLRADSTGERLTLAFDDLPPIAWRELSLELDSGPGALLATPLPCGSLSSTARLVSDSGAAPAESSDQVAITAMPGGPCLSRLPFGPRLATGTGDTRAGRFTSFTMNLRRSPGEEGPERFSVVLPPGMSATAGGSDDLCSEVGAKTGFCPAPSRVGSAQVAFGSGPAPATLTGSSYLAGPYRRAPYSLVLAFRGLVGPFDLGMVTLRAALKVDRRTGQLSIESDAFPPQIEGIPVRLRSLQIGLDRPEFIRNATSCRPSSFVSTMRSRQGDSLGTTSPYAATACDRLRLDPSFSIDLAGRSQLRAGGHPRLSIRTKVPAGNANLRGFSLWLPKALRLDTTAVAEICSRRDAIDGLCPAGARVGTANARTPLVDAPLHGPIYVVQPEGDGYPDLWVGLRGGAMSVELGGRSKVRKGRFATIFSGIPDMPMTSLTMRLAGGEDGLLTLRSDPCRDSARRLASRGGAQGQNGARRKLRVDVETTPRCPRKKQR